MSLRRTTLSPLVRSSAALALTVFVVALTMCFIHCHFGGGHSNSDALPSCHGSAQAQSDHEGHDAPAPAPTTSCATFKTMLAGGDAPTLVAPQLHKLYLPAPITLALDATELQPKVPFFRQVRTRDWVFTPLVCLGPAFPSLAPPFVA
jgi:hypothetical protein